MNKKAEFEISGTRCHYCNSEMSWNSDCDFRDYGMDGEGVISYLTCTNEDCNTCAEFFRRDKDEDEIY